MELSETAKELVKHECETVLSKSQALINELSIYKWAARGTILGFFKIQEYIDSRIAVRTDIVERLLLARSLTDNGQLEDALSELLAFAKQMSDAKIPEGIPDNTGRNLFGDLNKASASLRAYYFLAVLDNLSSVPDPGPDLQFSGENEWHQFLTNTVFVSDFFLNPRWSRDQKVLNRMALGTIKFSHTVDEALIAEKYFRAAVDNATSNGWKSGSLFGLAQLDLLRGDAHAASLKWREADAVSPNWVKDATEYF